MGCGGRGKPRSAPGSLSGLLRQTCFNFTCGSCLSCISDQRFTSAHLDFLRIWCQNAANLVFLQMSLGLEIPNSVNHTWNPYKLPAILHTNGLGRCIPSSTYQLKVEHPSHSDISGRSVGASAKQKVVQVDKQHSFWLVCFHLGTVYLCIYIYMYHVQIYICTHVIIYIYISNLLICKFLYIVLSYATFLLDRCFPLCQL